MYKQCVSYANTCNFKVQDTYKIQGFTTQGFTKRSSGRGQQLRDTINDNQNESFK